MKTNVPRMVYATVGAFEPGFGAGFEAGFDGVVVDANRNGCEDLMRVNKTRVN